MSQNARDWLPHDAFTVDAVNAVLADALAQWSASWFPRQTAAISHIRTPVAEGKLENGSSSAAVEFSESGRRQILEASLDINLFNQSLRDGDRQVLTAFVDRVAQDLIDRLDTALGHAKAQREGEGLNLAISIDGGEAVTICVPKHAFVPALRKRLGPPRRRGSLSKARLNAAGPIRVGVRGILGNAELSLIDLKDLSVGDVLILDRSLAETVELRLSENRRSVGHGKLSRSDGRVSIRF